MTSGVYREITDLLNEEIGTVCKSWDKDVSIALVYPNTYHVAMSNLGFQVVYRLFNNRDDVICERAFLPDRRNVPGRGEGKGRVKTLESNRDLLEFDIIAFSVPFENDFSNILEILSLSAIPLEADRRMEGDPLVIAGGITSYLNPEPMVDFIDTFLVGEGEAVIGPFLNSYKKSESSSRKELLARLSGTEGVYVPSMYDVTYSQKGHVESYVPVSGSPEKVKRKWLTQRDYESADTGSSVITKNTEFSSMYLVEVGRGCGRGCRFCAAGFISLPPRTRDEKKLLAHFEDGLEKTDKIGLISPSLADHPDIEKICSDIVAMGGRSSISSVRADKIERAYLEHIKKGGQKTVTLAPEAGTERLRDVINKGLSDYSILEAVKTLAHVGIPNIRLYFMIGLPTESETDIDGIISLSIKCRNLFIEKSRVHGRVGNITVSVNSFVPKPFTPFQWHPMDDEKLLKRKMRKIKKALGKESNIAVINDVPKWSHIQGLLSRGDRRVGKVIHTVYRNGGDWKSAVKEAGIDPLFYTTRAREKDELFPWEIIDIGLNRKYLRDEYLRGLEGKHTPPCKIGSCTRCGVC